MQNTPQACPACCGAFCCLGRQTARPRLGLVMAAVRSRCKADERRSPNKKAPFRRKRLVKTCRHGAKPVTVHAWALIEPCGPDQLLINLHAVAEQQTLLTGGSQHTYSGLGHHIACCAPLLLLPAQAHLLESGQRILVQGGQMHIGAGHRGLVGRRGSHHTVMPSH